MMAIFFRLVAEVAISVFLVFAFYKNRNKLNKRYLASMVLVSWYKIGTKIPATGAVKMLDNGDIASTPDGKIKFKWWVGLFLRIELLWVRILYHLSILELHAYGSDPRLETVVEACLWLARAKSQVKSKRYLLAKLSLNNATEKIGAFNKDALIW